MTPARPSRAVRRVRISAGILVAVALLAGTGVVSALGSEQDVAAPVAAAPVVAPPVVDVAARDQPVASRSGVRTRGPRVLPAPTAKKASCRLDLGYGVWALDITAARTLTMLTAVAYRDGRNYARAARAFERQLKQKGRTALGVERAEHQMKLKRNTTRPRTTSMDAVHALFRPATLFCAQPIRTIASEPMLPNGLTNRSVRLTQAWFDAFGARPIGGYVPGGFCTGRVEGSAHYDGRAVDIFFSLDDPNNRARGWLLSQWLVAHADYHQVSTVIFDDRIWSRTRSPEGWRPYVHPSGNLESVTLRHLDHIHVDVVDGLAAPGAELLDPCPEEPVDGALVEGAPLEGAPAADGS